MSALMGFLSILNSPVITILFPVVFSFIGDITFLFKRIFRWFVSSPFLIRGMTTRSRTLAWRTPCTEEPGGLQSPGVVRSWTQLIE